MTPLEHEMYLILRTIKGIDWATEHKFAYPKSQWRIDFADPRLKIGIEVEGGIYMGRSMKCNTCGDLRSKKKTGRHTSGAGYEKDCEKYNAARLMGWDIMRYTSNHIKQKPLTIRNQVEYLIKRKRGEVAEQLRLDMQLA